MPNNKIMIVEDEEIVAADIQMSVEKMGYSVCAKASSGMEAIEKANLTRPDLILMDIVLKGRMDGIEAATQIKELYKIPVVYLTAFGEDSMVQQAKVAEPYGYITKPFRDRDLQIAIEISLYKKQAEERIRKIELWLATVLRSVGDAVIASDKDRQITFMNEVAEKLTGWNKEDALGKKLTDILNIKDQDLNDLEKHLVEKVITEGLIINLIEGRLLIAKDGRELPISDSAAPIKEDNGETPGTVIVFRDVTERMRAEENLRVHQEELEMQNAELLRTQDELEVSRANYFDLYDLAPVSYFTISEKGLILEANLIAATLLGITRSELIKQPLSRFILPEDQAIYYRQHKQLLATGESQIGELRMLKKDGTASWAHLVATALQDAKGEIMCRVVLTDITSRKNAEEEKRILEERLSRAEKMESLGLLAGGVAHDLNNVLGIVVGYAELVLDSVDEKSPLRKDLTTIFDGGQKAAAIVEDLLTLARRGVLGKKVLNLNKLIGDFKKSPQWEKLLTYHPHVSIKTELDPDLLNISASSIHLEKALYNLVSNAGESMTKGGNIIIRTSNQYIDKPISGCDNIREGDYVVLSVTDEGEGISENDLKRIFEPFYTKKIMGRSGTGLGLSVVWGTVKDHQGYIDVQSEEGKGTTFTLYFLITREDIPEEGLAVSMSEYLGNEESILVVDDVKEQRDLAARLLTALNYKVSSVSSGEEAIKYLKDHQPDLIVLDMIMDPGMDGLDTYKSILQLNPKQKAIIVSGFSESDRVKQAKTLGAGAYIKKPYIKEKLGLAVKKELGNKR